MMLGCGGGIAWRITVRHAIARATTEARLSPTATATHCQRTAVNASPIALQLGPRHQSSTATTPMKMIVIAKRVAFELGRRRRTLFSFTRRPRCRCRRGGGRSPPRRSAPARAAGRQRRSSAGAARRRAAPRPRRRARARRPAGTSSAVSGVMTSRYPGMSDATTGVAQAIARTSTIPKLSPPSDGATSAFAASSSSVNSSCGRKPSTSTPSSGVRRRVISSRTASGSAPQMRSVAPVRARISGHARSRTCSPLRASCRPAKTTRFSRPAGSACGGISTPFGTISYSPGSQRSADSRARSETAMRWSSRSARKPHTGVA